MTEISTLPPGALADATKAAEPIVIAQLGNLLQGKDPEGGYRRAGLPQNGRVMVVIAYQGCGTHNFAELEKKAQANKAKLYIINGNPEGADAVSPSIIFKENGQTRTLNKDISTVYTPKNASGKLMIPKEILALANDIGLSARLDGQGTQVIVSTGEKLFENGKIIPFKTSELSTPRTFYARA